MTLSYHKWEYRDYLSDDYGENPDASSSSYPYHGENAISVGFGLAVTDIERLLCRLQGFSRCGNQARWHTIPCQSYKPQSAAR